MWGFSLDFGYPLIKKKYRKLSIFVIVLQLRNGISRNSPMLGQGRYCGSNPGTQFETSGNHLRISFKGLTSEAVSVSKYAK